MQDITRGGRRLSLYLLAMSGIILLAAAQLDDSGRFVNRTTLWQRDGRNILSGFRDMIVMASPTECQATPAAVICASWEQCRMMVSTGDAPPNPFWHLPVSMGGKPQRAMW